MSLHDKRLHVFRPDLADRRLQGKLEAERFVEGAPMRVTAPVVDILGAPQPDAGLLTQFLLGDGVQVFDQREGWAWVQGERDGYVGYASADALGLRSDGATHVVAVPRTFVYRGPDLRFSRSGALSLGSAVTVTDHAETRGTRYAILATGEALVAAHLVAAYRHVDDYVAVAESLLHTPYLWGGVSGFGIDCSGLVQLSMRMTGREVLRDTDMQATTIGEPVERSQLTRGDLVFWKGHVAIMTDEETMVHASGHTMMVSRERLDDAIARIGYLYGGPTGFRRP